MTAVLKWAGIVIGGLFALAIGIVAFLMFKDWADTHKAEWREIGWNAVGGIALMLLYSIFQEVRSIRRMMNSHLGIKPD